MSKPSYRHGPLNDLHINLVERIIKGQDMNRPGGFCKFPDKAGYDGCVVLFDNLPGVKYFKNDTDTFFTAGHEAGQYLAPRAPRNTPKPREIRYHQVIG